MVLCVNHICRSYPYIFRAKFIVTVPFVVRSSGVFKQNTPFWMLFPGSIFEISMKPLQDTYKLLHL